MQITYNTFLCTVQECSYWRGKKKWVLLVLLTQRDRDIFKQNDLCDQLSRLYMGAELQSSENES